VGFDYGLKTGLRSGFPPGRIRFRWKPWAVSTGSRPWAKPNGQGALRHVETCQSLNSY